MCKSPYTKALEVFSKNVINQPMYISGSIPFCVGNINLQLAKGFAFSHSIACCAQDYKGRALRVLASLQPWLTCYSVPSDGGGSATYHPGSGSWDGPDFLSDLMESTHRNGKIQSNNKECNMQKNIFCEDFKSGSSDSGFIVISTNAYYPGCVIIGTTHQLPNHPAVESSKNLFEPFLVVVHWSRFVHYGLGSMEKAIRKELGQFKKKPTHFKLPIEETIIMVESIIENYFSGPWEKIKYRKKQDARWGFFFAQLNIPFLYIERPMRMIAQGRFMPDFWLRDQNCFMLVSEYFSDIHGGEKMVYRFAKEKDKVIFRFWDCEEGLEYAEGGVQVFHTGSYMTPEGDSDGGMKWGICKECRSIHIGHFGFPELYDDAQRNTSKTNCRCHTDGENEELIKAYRNVQSFLGSHD